MRSLGWVLAGIALIPVFAAFALCDGDTGNCWGDSLEAGMTSDPLYTPIILGYTATHTMVSNKGMATARQANPKLTPVPGSQAPQPCLGKLESLIMWNPNATTGGIHSQGLIPHHCPSHEKFSHLLKPVNIAFGSQLPLCGWAVRLEIKS